MTPTTTREQIAQWLAGRGWVWSDASEWWSLDACHCWLTTNLDTKFMCRSIATDPWTTYSGPLPDSSAALDAILRAVGAIVAAAPVEAPAGDTDRRGHMAREVSYWMTTANGYCGALRRAEALLRRWVDPGPIAEGAEEMQSALVDETRAALKREPAPLPTAFDAGRHERTVLVVGTTDKEREVIAKIAASTSPEGRLTIREACRRRMPLDGTDAQCLEHALVQVEEASAGFRDERDKARESLRLAEWAKRVWRDKAIVRGKEAAVLRASVQKLTEALRHAQSRRRKALLAYWHGNMSQTTWRGDNVVARAARNYYRLKDAALADAEEGT